LHLLSCWTAWPDADAEATGLDLLPWNLRFPQRQDVAWIGRAHDRRGLRWSHVQIGREMRFKWYQRGPKAGPKHPNGQVIPYQIRPIPNALCWELQERAPSLTLPLRRRE